MKKLIFALLFLLVTSTAVFASGGQNQGTMGDGTTSTGSSAEGSASQSRAGR